MWGTTMHQNNLNIYSSFLFLFVAPVTFCLQFLSFISSQTFWFLHLTNFLFSLFLSLFLSLSLYIGCIYFSFPLFCCVCKVFDLKDKSCSLTPDDSWQLSTPARGQRSQSSQSAPGLANQWTAPAAAVLFSRECFKDCQWATLNQAHQHWWCWPFYVISLMNIHLKIPYHVAYYRRFIK